LGCEPVQIGIQALYLMSARKSQDHPVGGGSRLLQKVDTYAKVYTISDPKIPEYILLCQFRSERSTLPIPFTK